VDVHVPLKEDKQINRGFGFVEFATKEEAMKAISEMNGKQFKGRTLAVELSVPKGSYEAKVQKIVEHTKLSNEQAHMPKVLREEKKKVDEAKAKEEEAKKEYLEKNAKKIKKQEKKKAKKELKEKEAKKQFEQATESVTLFVRNIGFETNQDKFKEFMEKFGPVKYALLCKANQKVEGEEGTGEVGGHKGTGFVKFKSQESAT
jgi:RNA recognition motif-containing protein